MKIHVYVVTYTNRDEVFIDSIWSTPEQAEEKIQKYGDTGPYKIEEWVVDPEWS